MAVLITRPGERGERLVEMLNKAGIMALHLPLISIIAGQELNRLPNKLQQLNCGDYVVAVSKNAVEYAQKTLSAVGFCWRSDLYYFTVGQRTAEYFASQIENSVYYPVEQESSEGLLNLPQMQDLQARNILILRANGGREFLLSRLFCEELKLKLRNVINECPLNIISWKKLVYANVLG